MNIGEFSIRRTAGACAATAIKAAVAGLLLAGTAAAQPWDVSDAITGSAATPVANSPWSFHQKSGTGCAVSGPQLLLPASAYPTQVRGFTGNLMPSGPLPLVWGGHNNVGLSPAKAAVSLPGGTAIPINGVLMHPHGGLGECVAVRFAPGAGTYNFIGRFYGAYPSMGISCGNGVLPKLLKNGTSLIGPALGSTANAGAQSFSFSSGPLSAGEFVDFAIHNNGSDYQCDSTILELRVTASATMYAHGVVAVTPGPVNTCAPYKLCFDVNVPNGPLGNGSANLSLQIVNNSVTPPTVIATPPPKTTAVDGLICFDMPALPAGTSYDYVVTTNFTQPVPGGNPLTAQTVLQSPIQGPNNDLVCSGPTTSDCCPTFLSNNNLISMFSEAAHTPGTPSVVSFVPSSPSHASFTASVNAYLGLVRTGSCGQGAAGIKVTYSLWNTNSPTPPTAIPAGYGGWMPMPPSFSYTYNGFTSVLTSGSAAFSLPVSPTYVVVVATAQVVNANGQTITCSDFSGDCFKKLRFYDINNAGVFKVAPGAVTPSARSKF